MTVTRVLADDFRVMPYWWVAAPPDDSETELPHSADVAIVGGGYCGLCAALELAENGASVAVLEAGALGAGASTRNGGMVTGGQKFVVSGALDGIDPAVASQILEDARESLALLEARIEKYRLDADYRRCGRLILATNPKHFRRLETWRDRLKEHSDARVAIVPRAQQHSEIGSDYYHGGLLIEDYGGLHPAKYHRSLREAAVARGASLHARTPVTAISGEPGAFSVVTASGTISAREVFVATNGYTGDLIPFLQRRVVPVQSYVIATEPLPEALLRKISPRQRMFSDSKRDLFYFRLSPDGTRVIFGARPGIFDVAESVAAIRLHAAMCRVWPELIAFRVDFCWTGNVGMSYDKFPHMGRHAGIHYALGCNGSGVAMMSYLGYQTARKILAKQNRPCAFDGMTFPRPPLYDGRPWFLPMISGYYRTRDHIDRLLYR